MDEVLLEHWLAPSRRTARVCFYDKECAELGETARMGGRVGEPGQATLGPSLPGSILSFVTPLLSAREHSWRQICFPVAPPAAAAPRQATTLPLAANWSGLRRHKGQDTSRWPWRKANGARHTQVQVRFNTSLLLSLIYSLCIFHLQLLAEVWK